ncbi:aldehyde dehydrogenase family 3 member A2 [Octopus bimaculoides]|uniref:Aldehyde dehydrogenase n=1 Tax=Octopus bimaculoides TaxID=37653 RepID=A0A0L8GP20_OCTBM|nr:aldehyde dehydrogenase family 3 member A2 [Octopus bimaculoides]|eukprot:XP_014779289.1 PREDICTED: fatty aldehyde dehydrogenase-like [Octopus bimaculoides]
MSAAPVVAGLRKSFQQGITKPYEWRRSQLLALLKLIDENYSDITAALKDDLNKSEFESRLMEVDTTRNEIVYHLNNLSEWMKPTHVKKTLINSLDTCMIKPEPYGVALVLGAWNYPLYIAITPVIGAISAGNCVLLKPSEISECTSNLLSKLIPNYLDDRCIKVMMGGIPETTELLKECFDYIFYTGSTSVGKIIMSAAATHLTPVTLELGGKSPVYVDKTCDIPTVANRIMWGKCANSGQTCIAPDFVICSPDLQQSLVEALKNSVTKFFGTDVSKSEHYCRIINNQHFLRLKKLLEGQKPAFGGDMNEADKFIAPTVLTDIKPTDQVMESEIFGPILPILPMENVQAAIDYINSRPKPLALYIFSNDSKVVNKFLSETSSGGVCVNDTLMHIALETLPFGGVGKSGMGAYHGKFSFDTFSHMKSIMWKSQALESINDLRYPPYTEKNMAWLRRLSKKSVKSKSWLPFSLLGLVLFSAVLLVMTNKDHIMTKFQ